MRFESVMETEAWLLALSDVFQKIDNRLDADGLITKAGVDVNSDPQTAYFRPYSPPIPLPSYITKYEYLSWLQKGI